MNDANETEKPIGEERAAILLIHGIGEQSPYETLDQFTRGLVRYQLKENFVKQNEVIEPTLKPFVTEFGDVSGVSVQLTGLPFKQLDLYEYYWADKVQGRITWYKSLWFLIRTGFASLNFRKQLPMLLESQNGKRRSPLLIITQEILTALFLLLVIALLVTVVVMVAAWSPNVIEKLRNAGIALSDIIQGISVNRGIAGTLFLLFGIVWFYLLANIVQDYWQSQRIAARHGGFSKRPWYGMGSRQRKEWILYSALVFVIVSLIQVLLYTVVQNDVGKIWGQVVLVVQTPGMIWGLILLLLGVFLRWFLVDYIGDIVLYVTTDPKSPHYETRCKIRKTCGDTLRGILKQDYDVVYLLGHSLGSVIAYDMLNELSNDLRLELQGERLGKGVTKAETEKLKGLLTFGSPLDKVFYFFRTNVSDEQAVRSQLLSYVFSSRKQKSKRDYGNYKFEQYESHFQQLYWVNLYSYMDIISGHLDFYTVDKQCAMPFWNPVTAHGQYWRSLAFYEWVNAWLVNARRPRDDSQKDSSFEDVSAQEKEVSQKTFVPV